jgi:hypothetical protein
MFDRDDKTNGNNSKLSAWYYNNNLRAVFLLLELVSAHYTFLMRVF